MDQPIAEEPRDQSSDSPTREELQAELVPPPDPLPPPKPVEPPGLDYILDKAIRHIRGRRGGDLLAILLVGSATRRSLTPHSDIDLIAIIKGDDDREEFVRIADRHVEILYRGERSTLEDIPYAPRLPPLLRKARILYEQDAVGTKLIDKASQRFRQGPPPVSLNEKIRMKAQCLHWLGKAKDLAHQPATCQYLLHMFVEEFLYAFFRFRGLWVTSPADTFRFLSSRDAAMGDLVGHFMIAQHFQERLSLGYRMVDQLFQDIPNLPRID